MLKFVKPRGQSVNLPFKCHHLLVLKIKSVTTERETIGTLTPKVLKCASKIRIRGWICLVDDNFLATSADSE